MRIVPLLVVLGVGGGAEPHGSGSATPIAGEVTPNESHLDGGAPDPRRCELANETDPREG